MITEKKYNTTEIPKEYPSHILSLSDYQRTILTDINKQSHQYIKKRINPVIFVGLEILSILESNSPFSSILNKSNYEYVGKLYNIDVYLDYNINSETVILGNSKEEIKNYILIKQRKHKLKKINSL